MKKLFAGAAATTALALSVNCQAEGVRPVLGVNLTGGGKTLVEVIYSDGHTQEIRSGGLIHLFGGAEYETEQMVLQANVGYHVDDTTARNGSVKFSRWPVEFIGLWKIDPHLRAGLGLRKATSAKVTSSGAAAAFGSVDFDSNAGLILQGEYLFSPHWAMQLRFVNESYEIGGTKIQGNHIGLGGSFRF